MEKIKDKARGLVHEAKKPEIEKNLDNKTSIRLISPEKGQELISQGWLAADLHVHTFYSYDVIPAPAVDPLFLYQKAKAMGLSFVAFTDHDTMEAYERIGWTREDIITGVEVKILDRKRVGHTVHINIYTLNKTQFREVLEITGKAQDIESLIQYLKSEKLPFTFNHPFWHEPGERLRAEAVVEIAELFPVLEYNMGRIKKLNRIVLDLARAKNKGVVASTDSHTGEIGRVFTVAEGSTFQEFFGSVEKGQGWLVAEDLTYDRIKAEIFRRLDMLMDKQSWVTGGENLNMATGNAIVDKIIQTLGSKEENTRAAERAFSRLLKLLVRSISHSGLPATLYLRQQNQLASQVKEDLQVW